MMKGLLGLAVLAALLGAPRWAAAQSTTTTSTTTTIAPTTTTTTLPVVAWKVILPADCTGVGAPVACCVSATPAANSQHCNVRMAPSHLFEYVTTLNPNGGTYVTGGTTLVAAQRQRIGLNQIIDARCYSANGRIALLTSAAGSPNTLKVKLFNSGGTETSSGTVMTSGTESLVCRILGY